MIKRRVPFDSKARLKKGLASVPGAAWSSQQSWRLRMATASMRMKPAFTIIGTQRGGTSSFYWNLVTHPQIMPATRKEIHFFDRDSNYHRGLCWYRAHFPLQMMAYLRPGKTITGEASPAYMYIPETPERIAAIYPHMKFIVLLRDPIKRAHSAYNRGLQIGKHNTRIDLAIQAELDQVDKRGVRLEHLGQEGIVFRGVYIVQIQHWLTYFPREQFLILDSVDFFKNAEETLRQTTDFLGLDAWTPRYRTHPSQHKPAYASLSDDMREKLADFYRPYNEALYDFIGRDLGW